LIATFPDDQDTLEMKARALDWVGKSSQAVDVWKQCLKLNPDYIHAYVGMAAVAARNGNHQEAAELARKAIALSNQAFRARAILAEALINLGKSAKAVGVLNAFLTRDPRSQGYFLLGRAYSDLGQLAKAQASYESAIKIYPRYAEAFYALSRIYLRLKERDKARTAIAKYHALMLERKPTRPGMERPKDDLEDMSKNAAIIYTDVGRVYYVKNKPKLAERVWRRAAALGPKNVPCRQGLAWLYRNDNRLSDTIKRLEEIAAIDPGKPSYYLEIGRLHAALNEVTAAEHAFETAATVDPKNPDAGNLALVDLYLATNQNLAKAVELAHELVKRNPSASNYARLAAVCFRNGDLAAAENAIARAVKAAPTNVKYKQLQRTIEKVTGK